MGLMQALMEMNAILVLALAVCIFSALTTAIFNRNVPVTEGKIWLFGMTALGFLIGFRLTVSISIFESVPEDVRLVLTLLGPLLLISFETAFMLIFTLPRFKLTRKWLHLLIAWQTIIAAGGFLSVLLTSREFVVASFTFPLLLLYYLVLSRYHEIKSIEKQSDDYRFTVLDDFFQLLLGVLFLGIPPVLWLMSFTIPQEDLLVLLLAIVSLLMTTILFRHPDRWFIVEALLIDFFIVDNASEAVLFSFREKHEPGEIQQFLAKILKSLELGIKEIIHQERSLTSLALGENHILMGRTPTFTSILITTQNNGIVRALFEHLHHTVQAQLATKLDGLSMERQQRDELKEQVLSDLKELLEPVSRELQILKRYFSQHG